MWDLNIFASFLFYLCQFSQWLAFIGQLTKTLPLKQECNTLISDNEAEQHRLTNQRCWIKMSCLEYQTKSSERIKWIQTMLAIIQKKQTNKCLSAELPSSQDLLWQQGREVAHLP